MKNQSGWFAGPQTSSVPTPVRADSKTPTLLRVAKFNELVSPFKRTPTKNLHWRIQSSPPSNTWAWLASQHRLISPLTVQTRRSLQQEQHRILGPGYFCFK